MTRWVPLLKVAVFLASLGPAAWLVWAAATGNLSADPLNDVTIETGVWTLRFLCLTLLATPLRRVTGWNAAIRFRRMLGLFAFFYGTLHFLIYFVLDRIASLDLSNSLFALQTVRGLGRSIWEDVYKRPFITIGFLAFTAMVPLAATSTAGMIRRLGGRRWQALHRLVYVSAVAGVVHYWWGVKADVRRPAAYAVAVGLLLGFRVVWARKKNRPAAAPARAAGPRAATG